VSAPFVFTKIQKALVKNWCEQGIRIFTYLDDGEGIRKKYATASSIVKWDIAASTSREILLGTYLSG